MLETVGKFFGCCLCFNFSPFSCRNFRILFLCPYKVLYNTEQEMLWGLCSTFLLPAGISFLQRNVKYVIFKQKCYIILYLSNFLLSTTYQAECTLVAEVHYYFYIFMTHEFLSQRQLKSITKFLVFQSLIKGSCLSQTRQGWVGFFSSLFQLN